MAAVTVLQARGLTRHFGGLKAVDGVDLTLTQGRIHALIGPNGAGKTTLVSLLCGRIAAQSGQILFEGRDITTLAAHKRVDAGIAYTFQITSIYARLSVYDNLALAAARQKPRDLRAAVMAALARVGLDDRAEQQAGTLSYGHQRLLEIAMGLALKPRLLILDEPTQGLAASEIERFSTLMRSLVPETTLLIIEHNVELVMALADHITVLEGGRNLADGPPEVIRADAAVQAAYLGGASDGAA